MADALGVLDALPEIWLYILLGLGAALENLLPIVPADTFVVVGGFVSALGSGKAPLVFLATWLMNVAGALGVYFAGLRYGEPFFQKGRGSHLMSQAQMARLGAFYDRWGVAAILVARFLPGFRAMVPVFAGVTHQHIWRVAPPIVVASAMWYGALVWAGWAAGANLERVEELLGKVQVVLAVVAVVLAGGVFWLWSKTRDSDRIPPQ